jgi:ParB family chromosome partitioning protein
MEAQRQRWGDQLPGEQEALFPRLLACDETEVHKLLAFCTAYSLNAVRSREVEQPIADQIAQALNLNMTDWWKPTRASYLAAVPKSKVLEAVTEAVSAEAAATLTGMKKDQLMTAAELKLAGKGWLPRPLRATPL